MSSYYSEIELNSSTLSINISPDKGVRLESMSIRRRGGKPKSKQAIIVELRVAPIQSIAPTPLNIAIPWKKGDPTKVEVQVTEVYEIELEAMTFDIKKKSSDSKKQSKPSAQMNVQLQNNMSHSRGLTPVGEGKGKVMTRNRKPILDDE